MSYKPSRVTQRMLYSSASVFSPLTPRVVIKLLFPSESWLGLHSLRRRHNTTVAYAGRIHT